jgi:long-chain acyl-CoA synthetase
MKERFHWAKGAQLIGASASVQAALAQALSGAPFRIGGTGALQAAAGQFETLTSGSSGTARRILRNMTSWIASFEVNAQLFGIGAGVQVAVLGDLQHSLSLYGAVEGLHLGARVQVLHGLPPARQLAALAQAEVIYASPAQLRLLLTAQGDLPGVRYVLVGGAKLDSRLRADLTARLDTGAQLREFYGAAEASFITLAQQGTDEASVGAPYPQVELALRGGMVWLRSPYTFMGYAGPDQGSAVWQDGWLSVGEMGRIKGGQLYLLGRAGRMVTVADHNVFPEEIEARMQAMVGVRAAAVLARRDRLRGVHMVAICMGDAAQEPAILAALRAEFGPLKAPKSIQWRSTWRQLPSGKTDYGAFQAEVDAWP